MKKKKSKYGKKDWYVDKKKEIEKKRCIECRRVSDDVRWDNEANGFVCYKCWVKLYI